MRLLRRCRFFLAFVVGLAVLLPPRLLTYAIGHRGSSQLSMIFCRVLLWGLGLRVAGRAALADRALVVANHVSWTDIVVLCSIRPLVFVAKSEVKGWPVLGLLAKLNGTIFIQRGERQAAREQSAAIRQALANGPVVLFAEGTTGNGDAVLPFHSTLFAAAEGGRVQPLALDYWPRARQWQPGERAAFAWDGDKTFWPHLVMVAGGEPIDCAMIPHAPLAMNKGERKEAAMRCRELIASAIAAQRAARRDD